MPSGVKIGLDNATFRGRLRKSPPRIKHASEPEPTKATHSQQIFSNALNNTQPELQQQSREQLQSVPPAFYRAPPEASAPASLQAQAAAAVAATWVPALTPTVSSLGYIALQPGATENFDLEPIGFSEPGTIERYSQVLLEGLDEAWDFIKSLRSINLKHHVSLQAALLSMACLIFVIGVAVSLQTWRSTSAATAQLQAISRPNN